jgi:PAS domain S-box-containing protein
LHRWIGASLQRKLVFAIAGLLVSVSVVFLFLVHQVYQKRLVAEHARASMQINRLLQATLENAMLKRDLPGLQGILHDLGGQPGIARVMIVNPEFEVRFSSDPGMLNTVLHEADLASALESRVPASRYLQSARFGEVLRSVNPVRNREPCSVCHGALDENPVNGLLVVDYDSKMIGSDALASTLELSVLGLLVILAVCIGIWVALVRLVLGPLGQMSQATRALSDGQFDREITVRGADEIAGLGESFNHMARRLAASRREIEQSERFLQSVIDAIPDGIRVIGPDYRIIKANAAYCRQIGQSPDRVLGSYCYRSSHKQESRCPHTLVCCPVVELCEGQGQGQGMTMQDRHMDAAGEDVFVEVSAARVDLADNGRIVPCVVEAIRSLDEQAKISQQQRLSEIGLLAAGVAHEIYNPLSSIDLGLSALQSELQEGNPENALEYFATIRTEIRNCIAITNSLLLLSAPAGEAENLLALDETIPGVLALLQYEAEQSDVVIVHDIPPVTRIIGSDSDIRMLAVNLALNAIHAMPGGGELRVSARKDDCGVVLEFADRGVGIAPADLDSIFMPFWSRRADSSDGRGLGLSIVKAILERNSAKISVESSLGKGSVFSILFRDADCGV